MKCPKRSAWKDTNKFRSLRCKSGWSHIMCPSCRIQTRSSSRQCICELHGVRESIEKCDCVPRSTQTTILHRRQCMIAERIKTEKAPPQEAMHVIIIIIIIIIMWSMIPKVHRQRNYMESCGIKPTWTLGMVAVYNAATLALHCSSSRFCKLRLKAASPPNLSAPSFKTCSVQLAFGRPTLRMYCEMTGRRVPATNTPLLRGSRVGPAPLVPEG